MKRLELIANQSCERELIESLENNINDFYYTLLPVVHGKGNTKYKLGTSTWPEQNFMLISYMTDEDASLAVKIINEIKQQFKREGIKVFVIDV